MNLILLSNTRKKKGSIGIHVPNIMVWLVLGLIFLAGIFSWGGYSAGTHYARQNQADMAIQKLHEMLLAEQKLVSEAKITQSTHLDALALQIASIEARMMRVDAIGERLVGMGKLDKEEFDFTIEPALGGVGQTDAETFQAVEDITTALQQVSTLLRDREIKLSMLEEQLLNHELIHTSFPSGKPVKKGWISSGFGRRIDPFTGKLAYHQGVDFAGKRGTEVYAVAAGVVQNSKKLAGYGNMVEIRHTDGYTTVYGHNKKNLVAPGDLISKGQVIALLGSSGRSSGPHVHFEVHKDGKVVNPKRYIK